MSRIVIRLLLPLFVQVGVVSARARLPYFMSPLIGHSMTMAKAEAALREQDQVTHRGPMTTTGIALPLTPEIETSTATTTSTPVSNLQQTTSTTTPPPHQDPPIVLMLKQYLNWKKDLRERVQKNAKATMEENGTNMSSALLKQYGLMQQRVTWENTPKAQLNGNCFFSPVQCALIS